MGRGRRNRISNRRLPTSFRSTLQTYDPMATLRRALGYGRSPFAESDFFATTQSKRRVAKREIQIQKSRQLAKSTFFKTFSPPSQVAGKSVTGLTNLCLERAQRSEVLHATKKTGRSGQKSPRWTDKSKIKC